MQKLALVIPNETLTPIHQTGDPWDMKYLLCLTTLLTIYVAPCRADEKKGEAIEFASGSLTMTAPANWEKKKPRVRIVNYEFAAPAKKGGDAAAARVTMMRAGGSVKDNIARWKAQFKLPGGEEGTKAMKITESNVNGVKVYRVDIRGTYRDRPRPFDPNEVLRKDYRMLAAILVEGTVGQVFIKMYGPAKTIEQNSKAFDKMVEGLKLTK